ncbi:MAG: NapC/NirT family cytochrome c [Myxococcales bacterium]|nr:MAG: NapC/NirT family cytochrome c [Myxococcales bacterium]
MSAETTKAVFDMYPMAIGLALVSSALATIILIWFLLRRPPLTLSTKVALFFGLGAFPILAALIGNTANFVHSKHRNFCSSCHVMLPYTQDSNNWNSTTLASRHARNAEFGDHNCYMCHQDYGMFGTVMTKMGGLRHAWEYYTEYQYYSLEQSRKRFISISLSKTVPAPIAIRLGCLSGKMCLNTVHSKTKSVTKR